MAKGAMTGEGQLGMLCDGAYTFSYFPQTETERIHGSEVSSWDGL